MKAAEALRLATAELTPVSDTARLDAELLMAHAFGIEREQLLLSGISDEAPASFRALVERRLAHEPVAYITGSRDFWTIRLEVAPGVLIPRPDSETLIEAGVAHFRGRAPRRILDLGTGSGALLLAALAEWPEATGLGIDASETALAIASSNTARLGFASRCAFRLGDWADGIEERFDLILCNPPYVEQAAELPRQVAQWEPSSALYAGADGLDAYRRLAPQVPPLLAPAGLACFEIGAGQADAVSAFFRAEGLNTGERRDLAGHVRCLRVTA